MAPQALGVRDPNTIWVHSSTAQFSSCSAFDAGLNAFTFAHLSHSFCLYTHTHNTHTQHTLSISLALSLSLSLSLDACLLSSEGGQKVSYLTLSIILVLRTACKHTATQVRAFFPLLYTHTYTHTHTHTHTHMHTHTKSVWSRAQRYIRFPREFGFGF